ncbi:MAG: AraC family transcriptional regulator [Rubrivivax sp.]|nr:MAG: AraC family transcriptional regulator [Rubrivivax sp.]
MDATVQSLSILAFSRESTHCQAQRVVLKTHRLLDLPAHRPMKISPINLKILAYTLEVEGFDSARVLQRCGIDPADDLQEQGEWMPVEVFDRMMAAAIEETQDETFGLVAGRSIALMKYGAITPLVLSTGTLRQMLDDLRRFARLVVERSEIELLETAQGAQLLVQPIVRDGLSGRFRTEQVATSAVQMLRFAGANTADIHEVAFPHALPAGHEQSYAAAFGPRLSFGQKDCLISFNPALLDAPLATHDPVAYVAARTRVESRLAALVSGSDLADQVRQWLLSAFPRLPTVAETAQHLGMSERTFRRQLCSLGLTHAELAQDCQRLTAERLLAERQLPLKQIAEALGFSSVHSFHRAFRRWSGATPSDWRNSQRLNA